MNTTQLSRDSIMDEIHAVRERLAMVVSPGTCRIGVLAGRSEQDLFAAVREEHGQRTENPLGQLFAQKDYQHQLQTAVSEQEFSAVCFPA